MNNASTQAFIHSMIFARANNIKLVQNKDNQYFFTWKFNNRKFVLANKNTEKPKGDFYYIAAGLHNLKNVYTYQFIRNEICNRTEDILNEFYCYKEIGCVEHKENFYKYNYETKKIGLGSSKSEMDIYTFLKQQMDPSGVTGLTQDEIMYYFQEKFNFKTKYKFFYNIDSSRVEALDIFLKTQHENIQSNKDNYLIALKIFNEIYQEHLFSKDGKTALKYLNNRGLDNEEIKRLGLGLGFNGSLTNENEMLSLIKTKINALSEDEKSKLHVNFGVMIYDKIGLIIPKKYELLDSMANRITFPIKNASNELVAFAGRTFNNSNENIPKYFLTKTNLLWKKSDVVYGLNEAKNNLEHSNINYITVVEGFMDAIALNKIGVPAVALMGVNCSDEQVKEISKLNNPVMVALDFDLAGQSNNKIVADKIEEGVSLSCDVLCLNKPEFMDSKDFDEYINQKDQHLSLEQKKELLSNYYILQTRRNFAKEIGIDAIKIQDEEDEYRLVKENILSKKNKIMNDLGDNFDVGI